MTRDDMEILLDFYLRGADADLGKESLGLEATSRQIEDFLWAAALHVETGIRAGEFDEK